VPVTLEVAVELLPGAEPDVAPLLWSWRDVPGVALKELDEDVKKPDEDVAVSASVPVVPAGPEHAADQAASRTQGMTRMGRSGELRKCP